MKQKTNTKNLAERYFPKKNREGNLSLEDFKQVLTECMEDLGENFERVYWNNRYQLYEE